VPGVGAMLSPLGFEDRAYTLVVPPFGVATSEVYREWDRLGGPSAAGSNDLEPAALSVVPALAEWRDHLWEATGLVPTLAGSGTAWFVEGAFPGPGRLVARTCLPDEG
ncbi:MAG: 4-(cytidine 5'-diphospho)-2-C-methyl-D-erythritol kinase, partial [Acidimicrobiales bacterium]